MLQTELIQENSAQRELEQKKEEEIRQLLRKRKEYADRAQKQFVPKVDPVKQQELQVALCPTTHVLRH